MKAPLPKEGGLLAGLKNKVLEKKIKHSLLKRGGGAYLQVKKQSLGEKESPLFQRGALLVG